MRHARVGLATLLCVVLATVALVAAANKLTIALPNENQKFPVGKPIMFRIGPSTALTSPSQKVVVDIQRLWPNQAPTSASVFTETASKLQAGVDLVPYGMGDEVSKYQVRAVPSNVQGGQIPQPLPGWEWTAWRHFEVVRGVPKANIKQPITKPPPPTTPPPVEKPAQKQ